MALHFFIKSLLSLLLLANLTVVPVFAIAEADDATADDFTKWSFDTKEFLKPGYNPNDNSSEIVGKLFNKVIYLLLTSIGTVALVALIIGGIMIMMSGANEALNTKGKHVLTYASLGLTIAFLSYVIVRVVEMVLK